MVEKVKSVALVDDKEVVNKLVPRNVGDGGSKNRKSANAKSGAKTTAEQPNVRGVRISRASELSAKNGAKRDAFNTNKLSKQTKTEKSVKSTAQKVSVSARKKNVPTTNTAQKITTNMVKTMIDKKKQHNLQNLTFKEDNNVVESKSTTHRAIKKASSKTSGIEVEKSRVDSSETVYMSEMQLEHFKQLLLRWKEELLHGAENTVQDMQSTATNFPDPVDRASQEEEFSLELRTRDRERKLLKKIGETLQRIQDNNYGYCDDCGAEIGVRRLEARPTATQCIECKTIAEIREKQIGDVGRDKEED